MNIPGLKTLRLLAQQPVALLPRTGMNITMPQVHALELTFDDGSVVNVPVPEGLYRVVLARLHAQGVGIEQQVSARAQLASPGETAPALEHLLPVDRPLRHEEIEAALRASLHGPSAASTIPASPHALADGRAPKEEP